MFKIAVNQNHIADFSKMKINNNKVILSDAKIQSYKVISWIQSNIETNIDIIDDKSGYYITNAKVIDYKTDRNVVTKIVLEYNDCIKIAA